MFANMHESPVCTGLGPEVGDAVLMKDRAALGHRKQRAMRGGGEGHSSDSLGVPPRYTHS